MLRIKCLDNELVPLYSSRLNYSDDAGVDLYCPETITVKARSQGKIDFKIQCEMTNIQTSYKDGIEYYSYMLVPRSSIVKTPLRMSNSIGIIDKLYRGNIMAFVDNISDKDYTIEKGTRLFQIIKGDLQPLTITIVNKLSDTERGEGGFGSTGK
jgi:dUTP pyrophosphatase